MLHARLKASLRWLMSSIPPTLHVSVLSSSHLDFCTFRAQPPTGATTCAGWIRPTGPRSAPGWRRRGAVVSRGLPSSVSFLHAQAPGGGMTGWREKPRSGSARAGLRS